MSFFFLYYGTEGVFIKNNFVKQLIISLSQTKLSIFFKMCEMFKTSYNLRQMEYIFTGVCGALR